jgi:hypothetical protein
MQGYKGKGLKKIHGDGVGGGERVDVKFSKVVFHDYWIAPHV